MQEWQNRKLGLVITWGTYSQWGIVESWSLVTTRHPWNNRPAQFATDAERDEALAQLSATLAGTDGYLLGLMIGGCVNHELRRRHAGHGGYAAEPVAADCHQCNPAGYVPGWLSETTGGN